MIGHATDSSVGRDHTAFLASCAFAHRGLHSPSGPPENSLAAFEAAITQGYGIECDVRLSRDGAVFVFHDDALDRLTEVRGDFAKRNAADLDRITLRGISETVPRLSALLALVAGRMPILIELKARSEIRARQLSAAVARELADYSGAVAVMSFHPAVSAWFALHAPQIVRGLVVSEQQRGWPRMLLRSWAVRRARAEFVALDIRDLPSGLAARARTRGLRVLSWTVRSDEEHRRAAPHVDAVIFEVPAA